MAVPPHDDVQPRTFKGLGQHPIRAEPVVGDEDEQVRDGIEIKDLFAHHPRLIQAADALEMALRGDLPQLRAGYPHDPHPEAAPHDDERFRPEDRSPPLVRQVRRHHGEPGPADEGHQILTALVEFMVPHHAEIHPHPIHEIDQACTLRTVRLEVAEGGFRS